MLSRPYGPLLAATVAGVVFAAIWVLLAAVRPGVTFHLAPLIVAAAVPVTHRLTVGRSARPVEAAVGAVVGAGLAALTLAGLSVAGLLEGPALAPFDSVAAESLVAISLGVLAGLAVQLWPGGTPASHSGDR